jgi:hypothetical protein
MAEQAAETIAKEAVHWVNSLNSLFIKHCRVLAADAIKLRLFQLDASRIILIEVALSRDSVCSLEALVSRMYERLWMRATGKHTTAHDTLGCNNNRNQSTDQPLSLPGKPRSELTPGPTKPLSYPLLVNVPALEARLKAAGDERLGLTQYVSDMVADFPFGPIMPSAFPFRPIMPLTPATPHPALNGGQPAPALSKYHHAIKLSAELDAAYPFPTCTFEGPDNAVCAMQPWAVPAPLQLSMVDYVGKDLCLMQPSLKWVSIQYNERTHSLRPTLAEDYVAELKQPTRLADVPHILQGFLQVHGFLSGWVWKMAETKKAVPFYTCWDKRMNEAAAAGTDLLATRHPMWVDADAVARVRNVQLKEEPGSVARYMDPEEDGW